MTRMLPTALATALATLALVACKPADVPQPAEISQPDAAPAEAQARPASGAASQDGVQTVGALEIASPWVRATAPNAPAAGGFLTIRNTGDAADRLVAAQTDAASEVQIHEAGMDGGVMRMRELTDGLEIPAGGSVELRPGSYHLMLMSPPAPLVAGDTVQIQLSFEQAGAVDVAFPVRPLDATSPGDESEGHH